MIQTTADFAEHAGDEIWVHYSNVPQVTINPKGFHQDPAGIYLFPKDFPPNPNWLTMKYRFEMKLDPSTKVLDLSTLSVGEAKGILDQLGLGEMADANEYFNNPEQSHNDRIDTFWEIMKNEFILRDSKRPGAWNKALQKLGYDAVFDDIQVIHTAEEQLLVLNTSKIQVLKREDLADTGYDDALKVLEHLKALVGSYGKVEVHKPTKTLSWGTKSLKGAVQVFDGSKARTGHYAAWEVTPGGAQKTDSRPSSIYVSLQGSSHRFDYSVGTTIERFQRHKKPGLDFKDLDQDVKRARDKIWAESPRAESSLMDVAGIEDTDFPYFHVSKHPETPSIHRSTTRGGAQGKYFDPYGIYLFKKGEHVDISEWSEKPYRWDAKIKPGAKIRTVSGFSKSEVFALLKKAGMKTGLDFYKALRNAKNRSTEDEIEFDYLKDLLEDIESDKDDPKSSIRDNPSEEDMQAFLAGSIPDTTWFRALRCHFFDRQKFTDFWTSLNIDGLDDDAQAFYAGEPQLCILNPDVIEWGQREENKVDKEIYQMRQEGKRVATSSVEAASKDDLEEKYAANDNAYMSWPVTVDGDDSLHVTCKFIGTDPFSVAEVVGLIQESGGNTHFPVDFDWEPITFDTENDGKVKVLELKGVADNVKACHDCLWAIRTDDYPDYKPHITVPDELWDRIKAEGLTPLDFDIQLGALKLEQAGEVLYEWTDSPISRKDKEIGDLEIVDSSSHTYGKKEGVWQNPSKNSLKTASLPLKRTSTSSFSRASEKTQALNRGSSGTKASLLTTLSSLNSKLVYEIQVAQQLKLPQDLTQSQILKLLQSGQFTYRTLVEEPHQDGVYETVGVRFQGHPYEFILKTATFYTAMDYLRCQIVEIIRDSGAESITSALDPKFKKTPTLWDGKTEQAALFSFNDKTYVVGGLETQWIKDFLDIPVSNLYYLFYAKPDQDNQGEEPVDPPLPTTIPDEFFKTYQTATFCRGVKFQTFKGTEDVQTFMLKVLLSMRSKPSSLQIDTVNPKRSKKITLQEFTSKGERSLSTTTDAAPKLRGYRFEHAWEGKELQIRVYNGDKKIAVFEGAESHVQPGKLYPLGIKVDPPYQRQGIATAIYQWAEELSGMEIISGNSHSPEGLRFRKTWDKRKTKASQGGDEDDLPSGVTEDEFGLSKHVINFFRSWDYWGKEKAAQYSKYPEVEEFLSQYRPKAPVTVYRGLRYEEAHKKAFLKRLGWTDIQKGPTSYKDPDPSSWTYDLEAVHYGEFCGDEICKKGLVLKGTFQPSEILVDYTLIPKDLADILDIRPEEQEIILKPGAHSAEIIEITEYDRSKKPGERTKSEINSAEKFEDEGIVDGNWGSQASGILFRSDDAVLLLLRSDGVMDPNVWGIPGGAVPVDENDKPMDPKTSAINEADEEMGGMPPHRDTGKHVVFKKGEFRYTTYLFEVDEEFSPILNWEHSDARWFPIDDLPTDIHPGALWAIEKIFFGETSAAKIAAIGSFETSFKGHSGEIAEVFRNPSSKEIRECAAGTGDARAFLVGDDLLMWHPFKALHFEVAERLKLQDPIPLMLYFSYGGYKKVAGVQVTDMAKNTKWDDNPEVKEVILNHPKLKKISEPDLSVGYYNEDIVGPWDELETPTVTAASDKIPAVLYHGSPRQGLTDLHYTPENARMDSNSLVEGEGIYLTESYRVARGYAGSEGSVYEVKLKADSIFLADKRQSYLNIYERVKKKFGIDLEEVGHTDWYIERCQEGRGSVTGFGDSMREVLINDESFASDSANENKAEEIQDFINQDIAEWPVVRYLDANIDDGRTHVYVVRQDEPGQYMKILREIVVGSDEDEEEIENLPAEAAVQDEDLYPTLGWVKSFLQENGFGSYQILEAYITGSVAKKQQTPDSDLDISMVIEDNGEDLLELNTSLLNELPPIKWRNVKCDFNFVFNTDPAFKGYKKIKLTAATTPRKLSGSEQEIVAYHGSNSPIKKFDRNFSAQGVFWFSENRDKILNGESGASSTKYLIEVVLTVQKTAGWPEYEKLMLAQIEQEGYDSIHLDENWVIFDPKNIKITGVTDLTLKTEAARKEPVKSIKTRHDGYQLTNTLADSNGLFEVGAFQGKEEIGSAVFRIVGDNIRPISNAEAREFGLSSGTAVTPEHQRQGIATALYVHAEKASGKKVIPSTDQTDDARKFWAQPNRPFGVTSSAAATLEPLVYIVRSR